MNMEGGDFYKTSAHSHVSVNINSLSPDKFWFPDLKILHGQELLLVSFNSIYREFNSLRKDSWRYREDQALVKRQMGYLPLETLQLQGNIIRDSPKELWEWINT